MNANQRIVKALLHLYPAAWRREYGVELSDVLLSQPLGARVIADVLLSALGQRVRSAEPWQILGTASLLFIVGDVVWSRMAGEGPHGGLTALVQPSGITFPTYTVAPLKSDLYVLLLMACVFWTHWRQCGTLSRAGVAAIKMTMLVGFPIFVISGAGLLMLTGDRSAAPSALEVMAAPVFMLPQHWLYGCVGAWLARLFRFARRRLTTT